MSNFFLDNEKGYYKHYKIMGTVLCNKAEKTNNQGFTLIELIIAIVGSSIIVTIAIPRFMDVRDRAKISAVESDVRSIRIALAQYEADYSSYKVGNDSYTNATGYEDFKASLNDPYDTPYITLPDTTNFYPASFNYVGNSVSYKITVKARDRKKTTLVATPSVFTTLSHFQEQVLNYLNTHNTITSELCDSEFKVPPKMAISELDELVNKKLISKRTDETGTYYTLE